MTDRRRIVVLTSCTGTKTPTAKTTRIAAEDLYAGEQHRRLMRGVRTSRSLRPRLHLDLWILSAGHGLVRGMDMVQTYDATFSGLTRAELVERSDSLGVRIDVERLLSEPFDLALLLLGDDYLRAAGIGPEIKLGGPVLGFCGRVASNRLSGIDGLRIVATTKREARRFSCGLVGLKGELGGRVLARLAAHPQRLRDLKEEKVDLLDWIEQMDASQMALEVAA